MDTDPTRNESLRAVGLERAREIHWNQPAPLMFRDNFQRYAAHTSDEIRAAGPRA